MAEEEKIPNVQPNAFMPGEEFSEDYANNFNFEHTVWDFKIIFGQLDQTSGKPHNVNWHTSMTMPWGVAKLLCHFLLLNIVAHELQCGPIHIPPEVMPPAPVEPTGENDTPGTRLLYKEHQKIYRSLTRSVDPSTLLPKSSELPE
ncbi:MAG TPA: DUF3467 domain-containing protein [Bryobacteraceae bacterium]|jgi:hypothetical protein|nr:DUF3467 domain-containing protein [Bryobacteraceae bacterium]